MRVAHDAMSIFHLSHSSQCPKGELIATVQHVKLLYEEKTVKYHANKRHNTAIATSLSELEPPHVSISVALQIKKSHS